MTNQANNHARSAFASNKVLFAHKNAFAEFLAELNEGHYEYTNFIYKEESASFDNILAFPNKRFLEIKKGVSAKFFGYDGKVTISAKGKVTLTYHQREDKEYSLSEAQEDKFQVSEENMLKFDKAFELLCSGRFKTLYTVREIFLYFLNLTGAATKVVEIDLGGIEENDFDYNAYLALK